MFPLVHELAAAGALIRVPVAVTCRVLGFSKQAYYQWRKSPVSRRDWEEAHLVNAARQVHADDPEFGYRFIADELADQGFTASERRIWRVCSQHGIFSVFGKRPGRTPKAGPPVHDDLVQRTLHHIHQMPCCSPILPNIPRWKGNFTCAQSRTFSPTGSWATLSIPE